MNDSAADFAAIASGGRGAGGGRETARDAAREPGERKLEGCGATGLVTSAGADNRALGILPGAALSGLLLVNLLTCFRVRLSAHILGLMGRMDTADYLQI